VPSPSSVAKVFAADAFIRAKDTAFCTAAAVPPLPAAANMGAPRKEEGCPEAAEIDKNSAAGCWEGVFVDEEDIKNEEEGSGSTELL
jgi:hypothetical protein